MMRAEVKIQKISDSPVNQSIQQISTRPANHRRKDQTRRGIFPPDAQRVPCERYRHHHAHSRENRVVVLEQSERDTGVGDVDN